MNIILGPPGTGKTTYLLELIDKYLKNGVAPERIGFISFTRKAVNEARDRAVEKFGLSKKRFEYFRTIHSLAFYQLGMANNSIMKYPHYKELGDLVGTRITGKQSANQVIHELSKGDQMVFIESLARLTCKSLKDTWHEVDPDFDWYELEHFVETLKDYKETNILFDFTDMLEKYYDGGDTPTLDVLFVDEAQDLSRLQWEIIHRLDKTSKEVFIAGDDDQAIFRWSGADVEYFIDLSKTHPTKVLTQSYRLPSTIQKFTNEMLMGVSNRTKKEFKPTSRKGQVSFINDIEELDLDKDKWLILVRNGYMMSAITEYLRICGFSYASTYENPRSADSLKAAISWEKMRANKPVSSAELKNVVSFLKDEAYKHSPILTGSIASIAAGTIKDELKIDLKPIWHEALTKMSLDDREYYIAARRRKEHLVGEARINVSTIHGAKGGECENVVLYTDVSSKTHRGMLENEEDETRVFYVGATRVIENLYIVQPQTKFFYNL